jgi:hypothetical protein
MHVILYAIGALCVLGMAAGAVMFVITMLLELWRLIVWLAHRIIAADKRLPAFWKPR